MSHSRNRGCIPRPILPASVKREVFFESRIRIIWVLYLILLRDSFQRHWLGCIQASSDSALQQSELAISTEAIIRLHVKSTFSKQLHTDKEYWNKLGACTMGLAIASKAHTPLFVQAYRDVWFSLPHSTVTFHSLLASDQCGGQYMTSVGNRQLKVCLGMSSKPKLSVW